jgi:hypothetical protein
MDGYLTDSLGTQKLLLTKWGESFEKIDGIACLSQFVEWKNAMKIFFVK